MLEKAKKILSNKEILLKILITFIILLVFKAGTYIPIPLIEITSVKSIIQANDFLTVLNAFSGGGLSNFSILALGISPYITSSIIVQMLQLVIPKLKEWSEQGEVGKGKINRITRYLTVVLAFVQALVLLFGLGANPGNILVNSLIQYYDQFAWFYFLFMALIVTAGSAFTMWLADLITRHGIGNGSSMIISAGIISSIPTMFNTLGNKYLGDNLSGLNVTFYIIIIVLYIAMILGVVYFEGAVRKIPVQYANRSASQGSDIPVKLNSANVIPVIFASTIMSIPQTIIGALQLNTSTSAAAYWVNQIFSNREPIGIAIYIILIVFFSFFYAFLTVDPDKISDNLDKQGAFIPGYRPGEDTKVQLSKMLFRITLIGATYLVIIAMVPVIVSSAFGFSTSEASVITIGGTSLIIVVGVAIETFRQIETASETKDNKGFLD